MNELIDLDANATTPLLPEVREAMFALGALGNPASAHTLGRRARNVLEDARERIAAILDADPDEVIFTSGATEANNLALFGQPSRSPFRVLASPMEHPCVSEPLRELARRGVIVEWLPVSPDGCVRLEGGTQTADLAVLQLVNHETGAIQPVRELAASGLPVHTDAAQAVGKMRVSFRELGVASLAASAHKFHGPPGIGVLLARRGTKLMPRLFGGHQQQGRRPGTETVALAVGMAVALELATMRMDRNLAQWTERRSQLWDRLQNASPVVLNGPPLGSEHALPTTLNVSFPGCRGDLLLMALDLAGVACSTGSACSSGSLLPSPVLAAMGVPEDVLRSAIRFSFGSDLDAAPLEIAARRIVECVRKVRGTAGE